MWDTGLRFEHMEIIYEDSQILICRKEAGLPVQSGRIGGRDLVSILKNRLWEQGGEKKEPYLGVVHRLDQPVEGLLAFAKTQKAAAGLSAQLSDDRMNKRYQAVVWLPPGAESRGAYRPGEKYVLENYLLKDHRTNSSVIVSKGTAGAKLSRLEYEIVECKSWTLTDGAEEKKGELALADIRLETGRHHQIRVQMAGAGMPLLGDRKYGIVQGAGELALCADRLQLVHPGTGKKMEFYCKPQGFWFQRFLQEGASCPG